MGHYRLHFYDRQGDLGAWHEVLQAHWWIDTFPSKEKTLLTPYEGFCKSAIESIQFQIVYLDKNDKPKQYTTKVYSFKEEDEIWNAFQNIDEDNARNWDKFYDEFEKLLLKCLKATNDHPKENLHNLRSVLWNIMSNALVKKIKEDKSEDQNKDCEFFKRKHFEKHSRVDYCAIDCTGLAHATKKRAQITLEGHLYFGDDEYSLVSIYAINPERRWNIYQSDFKDLCDTEKVDWFVGGPIAVLFKDNKPYISSQGRTAYSLKANLALKIQDYFQGKLKLDACNDMAADIVSKLDGYALDLFCKWQKEERTKADANKVWYLSMDLATEDNFTWGCNFDVDVKLSDNKTATITFGLGTMDNGYLGLNYWNVFDKISITCPDLNVVARDMSLKDYQDKFKDIFKLVPNYVPFRRDLNEIFTTVAESWKKWYWTCSNPTNNAKESNTLLWQYSFNEPFMTFDSTVWGTGVVRIDFQKDKVEDAAKHWFTNRLKNSNTDVTKDQFGEYLLDFIYGTLTYKCSIPSNPNLIDCKIEEMGRGDFRTEVGKRFCKSSQCAILATLKEALINMFWKDDFRLPPDTKEVLNDLGATNEQKAKVANEFEMARKVDPCARNTLAEHEEKVRIALNELKKELKNFEIKEGYSTQPYPSDYYIACSFLNYYFTIELQMKDKFDVRGYSIKVDVVPMNRKCVTLNAVVLNQTNECCDDGQFMKTMSKYLGNDEYKAIALKRHILYKIESIYGLEIRWRD